ncbi:MAG: methyltransferase domain-containing protein [Myxococcales bacterium]|nr:methyltransferase domain-containing protein [Myxococcales bacterium]
MAQRCAMIEMKEDSGQRGLEDHYEQWFAHIESDFRATSLNRLVLGLVPQGRVLDLGCGSGALSAELWRAGRRVVSQDVSERMVAMCATHLARRGHPSEHVRLGSVDTIAERGAFDGVVALDVIEHIEDDVAALAQLRAALTPAGTLVISVPALRVLFGAKDVAVGHHRRYDRADLLLALTKAGFRVTSCRYWNALGIAPVWISNLLNRRLDESLRYSHSPAKRALNRLLRLWFERVENPLALPLGMTLIATARLAD